MFEIVRFKQFYSFSLKINIKKEKVVCCTYYKRRLYKRLRASLMIVLPFPLPLVDTFRYIYNIHWKHCGKRRNCTLFSHSLTVSLFSYRCFQSRLLQMCCKLDRVKRHWETTAINHARVMFQTCFALHAAASWYWLMINKCPRQE